MGKKESMLTYVDNFRTQIERIKFPQDIEEITFIRETVATMQGIIIAYIGFEEMKEVLEKAQRLQNDCYDLWHRYCQADRTY